MVKTSRSVPPETPQIQRRSRHSRPARLSLIPLILILVACPANGQQPPRKVPGKVVLIRGAFTVFSLGLDSLAKKLRQAGVNAQVVPGMSSDEIVSQVVAEHRRNPNSGPLILIGHSRGAELAADRARDLMNHRIAVDLIVVVDATHRMSVPPNVLRCINFYETNRLGVVYGKQASRENPRTKLLNININQLPGRQQAGYIDHFNIDASDWLHGVIIKEVIRTCYEAEAQFAARQRDARGINENTGMNSVRPIPGDDARKNQLRTSTTRSGDSAAAAVIADMITPKKKYMELRR